MPKQKIFSRRELPPCPDANLYMLVQTEEGFYWRRRRGTIKKAELNSSLAKNAQLTSITSPAASRLLQKLALHTQKFKKGRTYQRIAGHFLKSYRDKKIIDFTALYGMELNDGYPLDKLLQYQYLIKEADGHIQIDISIAPAGQAVVPQNELVTEYYFDLITISGDTLTPNGLQSRFTSSALYPFGVSLSETIHMELPIPSAKPWMVLLKVGCLEGNEIAHHYKNYGMRVVGVSS